MKFLIKPTKITEDLQEADGLILPLKDYSVDYDTYFTLEEIKKIKEKFQKEIFIVINRMILNKDIEELKKVLKEIEKISIAGILFYDLSLLQLKKELNLETDLVWNATHMTTNYKTCDYYFQKGVKYAYISNEITLREVLEIKEKSKMIPMFTLIGYPSVAMSRRHLITNYNKMYNLEETNKIEIEEKITNQKYIVEEGKFGTSFKYGKVLNNIEALEKLKEVDFPYLILIEDGIDHNLFQKVFTLIKENLEDSIPTKEIQNLLGDNTGFLKKETIYQVKKNG